MIKIPGCNSYSNTAILHKDEFADIKINGSRQNIPYILKWFCPKCKKENHSDYTDTWYLDQDTNLNNGIEKNIYRCNNEWQDESGQWKGCDGEITISIKISIVAEIVT